MPNYPDDCGSNNPNVPWNEPLVVQCFQCDEVITEDEESNEVLTKQSGYQHVHIHCLDDYMENT